MTNAFVVTGTMTAPNTLTLDEKLPMGGRVRVVVEPLETRPILNLENFLEGLRMRQAERGHVPMTREQIDQMIVEERAGWDDRP